MKRIRSYRSNFDAELEKGYLDAAGINSFLKNKNTVGVDPFLSQALGGIALYVEDEAVEQALEIIGREGNDCEKISALSKNFEGAIFRIVILSAGLTVFYSLYENLGADDIPKVINVFLTFLMICPIVIYCLIVPILKRLGKS